MRDLTSFLPNDSRLTCERCHGMGYEDEAAGKVAYGNCDPAPAQHPLAAYMLTSAVCPRVAWDIIEAIKEAA